MSDERQSSDQSHSTAKTGRLADKVVLLLSGENAEGHTLAIDLAEAGADVAIVYSGDDHERVTEIKRQVMAAGRHCLLISVRGPHAQWSSSQTVRRVVAEFGRLDIFIDNSRQTPDAKRGDGQLAASLFPNLDILLASVSQMVNGTEQESKKE